MSGLFCAAGKTMIWHAVASVIHRSDRDCVKRRSPVTIERSSGQEDQSFNFRPIAPKKSCVSQEGSIRLQGAKRLRVLHLLCEASELIGYEFDQITWQGHIHDFDKPTNRYATSQTQTELGTIQTRKQRDCSTSFHRLDDKSSDLFLGQHLVVLERFGALEPPGGKATLIELIQLLVGSALSLRSG
jgi:hypothetical protein